MDDISPNAVGVIKAILAVADIKTVNTILAIYKMLAGAVLAVKVVLGADKNISHEDCELFFCSDERGTGSVKELCARLLKLRGRAGLVP